MRALLDTNVLIAELQSAAPHAPEHFGDYAISVITEAELFRLPGLGSAEILALERLLETFARIPITSTIARRAAALGRTRKTKLPDLLIAATALELNLSLVTKNTRDFRRLPDLVVRSSLT